MDPDGTGVEFQDLPSMLAFAAKARPDKAALIFEGRTISWGQLHDRVERAAQLLVEAGLRPLDNVAILAESCPAALELFLGTLRAGGCAVPLSGWDDPATSARKLDDARPRVVVLSQRMHPLLSELPGSVSRVALDFGEPGWIGYQGARPTGSVALVRPRPDNPFDIIYSSGTTGIPKGIVHSHRMRSFQVERMARFGLGPDATTLISTPLSSNTTLVALLPALAGGGTVVLMPRFDAGRFLELCEAHRVTHAMLVPVQYRRILDHPRFDSFDSSSFRVKFSTAAPLSVAWKERILACWPGRLVEIYGATEGGCTTLLDAGAHPDKLHTVGWPAEGVEVRILDSRGRPLPAGEVGRIAGRAVSMMSGYHGKPWLTEEITWRDESGRAFYETGDLGRIDPDGCLELSGRRQDVIISGGFNIHPCDLEDVLAAHEAVAEVAVIAVPSERWGETPLALVVLVPGAREGEGDLLDWANARLGKVQRLSAVRLRSELPRDALGKLRRRALREPFLDRAD